MITLNAIEQRLRQFAENHFFIHSYGFGSPDEVDLDKYTAFPLLYVVYTGATYDDNKAYSFEVYVLDRPTEQEAKSENRREVVSDSEQCLEDLVADITTGFNVFQWDEAYNVEAASVSPIVDARTNVLSGALLDLTISVPYQYESCNLPIDGVQPQGGEISYARRGLLRILTQDGTTDVPSVNTIKVTNGTLTDEGDGIVSIDTGGVDILGDLDNVNLDDLQDHEALVYDQDTATWINGASTKIGIRVINQTGSTLFRGSPVKAVGVQGDQIQVALFFAASDDGKRFIGLLDSDLANGATGYARQTGMIYNLNTSAFNVGDILYPTNQGVVTIDNGLDFMQAFPPNGGAGGTPVTIAAAIVIRKHANTGRVYVRTWTPSLSLGALDDVNLDVAVLGNPNTLVYDGSKWIKGLPSMFLSDLRNVSQGTDDPPVGSILTWNNSTSEWIATPKASFLPSADAYFLNRYDFEAIAARQLADATLTIERYLTVQADGHGEEVSAQTDTPTSGNVIRRKIWYKAVSFEDSDVSTWTLVHTFADDTAYSATEATFDALLTAATYGSIPLTLAQTWEEVPAFTGLLDDYPGAAAALSPARLLDSTYTGALIRVRRASDNAEQDIGFDASGELDTSALATFCAGTDGYVVRWYDQSGNGNDAVQATTSAQPQIVASGAVVVDGNGKPRISLLSSNAQMNIGNLNLTSASGFAVFEKTQLGYSGGLSAGQSSCHWGFQLGQIYDGFYNNARPLISGSGTIAANTTYLMSMLHNGTMTYNLNGTQIYSQSGVFSNATSVQLRGVYPFQGYYSELIIYGSDQSANRAAIEANINAFYSIY